MGFAGRASRCEGGRPSLIFRDHESRPGLLGRRIQAGRFFDLRARDQRIAREPALRARTGLYHDSDGGDAEFKSGHSRRNRVIRSN